MNASLEGKVAVVTGAAQGIGAVYARHLARAGAVVVLADIEEAVATDQADAIGADGLRAWAAGVDIADPHGCVALIDQVVEREGKVDILVNNAAIYQDVRSTLAEDIDVDVWRRIVDVNVNGMFFMCRAVIPHMKEQASGVIVNQTSGSVFVAPPGMAHYVTTKAAAIPLTKVLARELGPFGVRVNAIAPGLTDTPATHAVTPDAVIAMSVAGIAMGRLATPDDLCGTLEFLCSDAAAFVTGQTIAVNGGSHMLP
ncbi:MAG: 3-oxoacyl-[acyl-carrier protein] reductase [Actinomycetota bacterium]|nr:3-oxoacyl-[acyl-carrier protein] reductase [Actinomycetota bacterium]